MAEDSKLNIRLHIYDTDMAVKINRSDEEMYRNAASLITEVVGNYTTYYKGLKSEKEILYMALVDITLRYEREAKRNDIAPYSEALRQLSTEINAALEELCHAYFIQEPFLCPEMSTHALLLCYVSIYDYIYGKEFE